MDTLAVDLETYSSVDLKSSGVYAYTQADDFEILLFGYAFDDEPVQVVDLANFESLPDPVAKALLDPEVIKTAFNAQFERTCLARHFNQPMPPEQWRCTAHHALTLGLPASLEKVAQVLKMPAQKNAAGKALIRYFSVPCKPTKANGMRTRNLPHHDPAKWQSFVEYNAQDVEVEREARKLLLRYPIPPAEQKLWNLDQKINDRGVRIDPVLVARAITCDTAYQRRLEAEAYELTGLDNPNSVAQLKAWLYETEGLEVESLSKDTVPELLKQAESKTTQRVLEIRQELAKASVKKYQAMARARCKDDHVRGLLQFYGANRTGRWAGRLVQVQNLPKNTMKDLDLARQLLRAGRYEDLEMLFESVPVVLSQLIRTAFIPSPGHRFIVVDFSAIEARVLAWLAGEQWVLDVFKTHGKIYEAAASQMFKTPMERITKGNPEYALRQKGKVAVLACGYGGGAGALVNLGALKMGLKEEELPEIIQAWREANSNIVRYWKQVELAAISAVQKRQPVMLQHGITFLCESGALFIQLPSGRRLAYVRPRMEIDTKFDRPREVLTYEGYEQGQWKRLKTYGGKLVENCLAGDTKVLTPRGWIEIQNIHKDDLLWDGITWVEHDGLINKGLQQTLSLDGVRLTPDHQVLTERGWRNASSCQGYYRDEAIFPDSCQLRWFGWKKIAVALPLRLWQRIYNAGHGILEKASEIMRLPEIFFNFQSPKNAWYVKASSLLGVAFNERPLYPAYPSSLGELWGPWYPDLPKVARQLRSVLGRHGADLQTWSIIRPNRGERELLPGKLPVGIRQNTGPEQAQQHVYQYTVGAPDGCRSSREVWNRSYHSMLQTGRGMARKPFICETGRYEPVYDLLNAGPKHRFTILGNSGPFLVHNCTQAVARDCLAEALLRLDAAGYETCMHVHDEAVLDVPEGFGSLEHTITVISEPITWAPGLPLRADGFETVYYKKDD